MGFKKTVNPRRGCAVAGGETPLTKNVGRVADWFTGTHDLAPEIVGVR